MGNPDPLFRYVYAKLRVDSDIDPDVWLLAKFAKHSKQSGQINWDALYSEVQVLKVLQLAEMCELAQKDIKEAKEMFIEKGATEDEARLTGSIEASTNEIKHIASNLRAIADQYDVTMRNRILNYLATVPVDIQFDIDFNLKRRAQNELWKKIQVDFFHMKEDEQGEIIREEGFPSLDLDELILKEESIFNESIIFAGHLEGNLQACTSLLEGANECPIIFAGNLIGVGGDPLECVKSIFPRHRIVKGLYEYAIGGHLSGEPVMIGESLKNIFNVNRLSTFDKHIGRLYLELCFGEVESKYVRYAHQGYNIETKSGANIGVVFGSLTESVRGYDNPDFFIWPGESEEPGIIDEIVHDNFRAMQELGLNVLITGFGLTPAYWDYEKVDGTFSGPHVLEFDQPMKIDKNRLYIFSAGSAGFPFRPKMEGVGEILEYTITPYMDVMTLKGFRYDAEQAARRIETVHSPIPHIANAMRPPQDFDLDENI